MDASQFRGEVIFTFDGDAAGSGRRCARSASRSSSSPRPSSPSSPTAWTRATCGCKHGDAAVRDLIAQRVPLFEFAIRSVLAEHNLDTAEGRLAALDAAAPIVGKIKDRGLRQLYAVNLDRWLGMMDEQFVHGPGPRSTPARRGRAPARSAGRGQPREPPAAAGARAARGWQRAQRPTGRGARRRSDPVNVERQVLKLAMQRPALCGPAFDRARVGLHRAGACCRARDDRRLRRRARRRAAREWAEQLREAAPNDTARLRDPAHRRADSGARAAPSRTRGSAEVLARVEELAVSREIAEIKSRLQRLSPVTEQGEYNRLFGDLVALEQRKKVAGSTLRAHFRHTEPLLRY